jgi:hypothetical protein
VTNPILNIEDYPEDTIYPHGTFKIRKAARELIRQPFLIMKLDFSKITSYNSIS